MPNYGDSKYWDQRYLEDENSPFDWLFDYKELQGIIEYLFPLKDMKILIVGSGNAPFSPEMSSVGHYSNIFNIDLSSVVINQQANKFPEQHWLVMDVLNLAFPDKAFPAVIDKSLIDTLLCCHDSSNTTQRMIDEIYRVMAPGSRYVTFSLHSIEEIKDKFTLPTYDWKVNAFRVKSNRWNERENCRRAVAHTMIICDKPDEKGDYPSNSTQVPGVLTDEEYLQLKTVADKAILTNAFHAISVESLRWLLFSATYPRNNTTARGWRENPEFYCAPSILQKHVDHIWPTLQNNLHSLAAKDSLAFVQN